MGLAFHDRHFFSIESFLDMPLCELYGGALSVVMPKDLQDISNDPIREIPDHQHVFMAMGVHYSAIIELCELYPEENLSKAVLKHYEELVKINEATSTEAMMVMEIAPTPDQATRLGEDAAVAMCVGTQSIKGEVVTTVHGVCRMPRSNTDVVLSFMSPVMDRTVLMAAFKEAAASIRVNDWALFG